MKKFISLFRALIKNWFRSKSGVFFSFLFPVMLLLIFSTVFGGQESVEYTLHVQNNDLVERYEFSLDQNYTRYLENGTVHEEMREAFEEKDHTISPDASMSKTGDKSWEINDNDRWYGLEENETKIDVYTLGDQVTCLSENFTKGLRKTETLDIVTLDRDVNVTEYFEDDTSFGESRRALIISRGFQEKALDKSMELRMKVIQDTMDRIGDQYDMNESEEENFTERQEMVDRWANRTKTGESAEVLLLTSEGDQVAPIIEGTVYGVVNNFNQRMMGVEDSTVEVESESIGRKDLEGADYYLPGLIAAFIMTNGIIGVTGTISEYKRNGTLKRLISTPLTKANWIFANVAQQTVLAFLLTGVMVLLGVVVFGVQVYPNLYALGFIFVGAVAFCSVGIVLGGLIKDVEAANGAGNAIAFPMMFLSGAFWPLERMPSYMQSVAKVLPLYYFHRGLTEIMILQDPSGAVVPFLIISVFGVIFMILATKVTRWKDM